MSIKIPGGGGGSGGSGDLSADGTGWPVTAAVTFSNNVTIANTKDLLAATAAGSDVGSAAAGFGVGYFDTSVETPLLGAATGNPTFADGADADPTKKLGFLLTGITTGTTRTITWPDADVTIPTTIGDFLADGTVAMTGVITVTDGAAGAPSIRGTTDADSGFTFGANTVGIGVNSTTIATATTSGFNIVAADLNVTNNVRANGSVIGDGATSYYGLIKLINAHAATATLSVAGRTSTFVTNEGATSVPVLTLWTAAAGQYVDFCNTDASDFMTVKPNTSDEIIWIDGTVVSAATGSITTTARYQSFRVVAMDSQTWIATDVQDRGTAITVVA